MEHDEEPRKNLSTDRFLENLLDYQGTPSPGSPISLTQFLDLQEAAQAKLAKFQKDKSIPDEAKAHWLSIVGGKVPHGHVLSSQAKQESPTRGDSRKDFESF